jgi:4-hydroxybenzoate polyprenyltransferase
LATDSRASSLESEVAQTDIAAAISPSGRPAFQATEGAGRSVTSSLKKHLSCVRLDEVLVLQGSPVLGAVFAMGTLSWTHAPFMGALFLGSCALVAHVYLFNDLSGMRHDLNDTRRAVGVFARRGIGPRTVGALCLAFLGLSAVLLSVIGPQAVLIAAAIALLSAAYSGNRLHAKGVPLSSSLCHLAGGGLHFLLGYSTFSPIDHRGLAIAPFFALMFAAGHLTHEARDFEADRANGVTTNAVAFGARRAFEAGLVAFALAHLVLFGLAAVALVPPVLVAVLCFSPLHFHWARRALADGLSYDSLALLRRRYRRLYAVLGLLILAAEITWGAR